MSSVFRIRGVAALAVSAALGASVSVASGGTGGFGSKVLSFYQGTGLPANYFNNPNSALGPPAAVIGAGTIFPNVLDPFSPAYGKNEIVVIGKNGQITLQLYKAVTVANTPQIGVISNVGLIDASYPAGKAGSPAAIFGGGTADVRVSSDAKTWVDLGNITFNLPASSFSKLGSAYETAPTKADVASNLGKPFIGKLGNFNGETLAQTLKTLNGSIGGTWLNVFNTHLKTVDYIQFRNPSGTTSRLAIDAVTISTVPSVGGGNPGAAVPLPAAAPVGLVALVMLGVWRGLRRRFA